MLCGDLDVWDGRGREVQEGGDMPIHIADSLYCAAETNTTLQSNYTPIKNIYMYQQTLKLDDVPKKAH